MLQPLRSKPESLTDMVFKAIRDAIVSKAIPPGGQISEASLAAQLNVSKTPVREALLRLRYAGLVEPQGRSLRVVVPSPEAIRDAYELRNGLEQTTAHHATCRASDAERGQILGWAESSLAAAQGSRNAEFLVLDLEFHRAVALGSHNPLLVNAVADALLLTAVLRARDVPAGGDSVACAAEHVRIARAISSGDDQAAKQLMGDHVQHVLAIVLGQLRAAAASYAALPVARAWKPANASRTVSTQMASSSAPCPGVAAPGSSLNPSCPRNGPGTARRYRGGDDHPASGFRLRGASGCRTSSGNAASIRAVSNAPACPGSSPNSAAPAAASRSAAMWKYDPPAR